MDFVGPAKIEINEELPDNIVVVIGTRGAIVWDLVTGELRQVYIADSMRDEARRAAMKEYPVGIVLERGSK
jgi:hypothetical protein